MPQSKLPKVALIDLDQADSLLLNCASALAIDRHTSSKWVKDDDTIAEKLVNGIGWVLQKEPLGHRELVFLDSQVASTTREYYKIKTTGFLRAALSGPAVLANYMKELERQTTGARSNVQFKAKSVAETNEMVKDVLERSRRRANVVKVAANASFCVGLSFVAAPVLVLTVAGSSYGLSCAFASALGEVSKSQVLAWTSSALTNGGVSYLVNKSQSKAAEKMTKKATDLLNNSIKKTAEVETRHASRVGNYMKQNAGGTLTNRQAKNVARSSLKVATQQAEKKVAQGTLIRATTKARILTGGLAAGIGLFFMRDELKAGFKDLTDEIKDLSKERSKKK